MRFTTWEYDGPNASDEQCREVARQVWKECGGDVDRGARLLVQRAFRDPSLYWKIDYRRLHSWPHELAKAWLKEAVAKGGPADPS